MTEQWIQTLDTRIATAMGTLGVPVRLKATLIERTGERVTRFFMALTSLDRTYKTREILSLWKRGIMEDQERDHPFLTIMRGIENRRAILAFQKARKFVHLARVPGTEVWQYIAGGVGLPGIKGHLELLETADIKMVSALGVVGFPLLSITGNAGSHRYYLPRYGPPRQDGLPPLDGRALVSEWRKDKNALPWENPFAQAARGLHNRERFMDSINREVELVMIMKPRSQRAAFIRADASPQAYDEVKKHFDAR